MELEDIYESEADSEQVVTLGRVESIEEQELVPLTITEAERIRKPKQSPEGLGLDKYEKATAGEVYMEMQSLLLSCLIKNFFSREGHDSHTPEMEDEKTECIAGCSPLVDVDQSNSVSEVEKQLSVGLGNKYVESKEIASKSQNLGYMVIAGETGSEPGSQANHPGTVED